MKANRVIVVPDLHGSDAWKKIVNRHIESDLVIFLGDYVDSYTKTDVEILSNLRDIVTFKLQNPDRVILLVGNHDAQYMFPRHAQFSCSGFRNSIAISLSHVFGGDREHFDLAAYVDVGGDPWVFSHAGFTAGWLKYSVEEDFSSDPAGLVALMNDRWRREDFVYIDAVSRKRGGWDHFGGPLWADADEWHQKVVDGKLLRFNQCVGHSRSAFGMKLRNEEFQVIFADNIETRESNDEEVFLPLIRPGMTVVNALDESEDYETVSIP